MHAEELTIRLLQWRDDDLAYRDRLVAEGRLGAGYDPGMAAIHRRNAEALLAIIEERGYPTVAAVGEAANAAAWLIVQHAIAQPAFMRRCAGVLRELATTCRTAAVQHAYLSDRIAVFEGRPQRYGTQFDWNENGELSPQPYDELAAVERRRAALGLNKLNEQTELLRQRALAEKEGPPTDRTSRQAAYDSWRREVGWL